MRKIAQAIGPLPLAARKSITFDRGSAFVTWPHLQTQLGTDRSRHIRKTLSKTPTGGCAASCPARWTSTG